MAETYSAGIVTAYGAAVRGGYTGTYEEFCAEQASFAENAKQVGEDREAMETLAAQFIGATVPAAVQTVQNAGAAQIQAVEASSETEQQLIREAGTAQEALVIQAGDSELADIQAAGTTQVGNVNAAGTTQVNAVQAKGQEVIDSIPEDYTDLQNDVGDLKSAFDDTLNLQPVTVNPTWEIGSINGNTGGNSGVTYDTRLRTDYVDIASYESVEISVDTGYQLVWVLLDGDKNALYGQDSWHGDGQGTLFSRADYPTMAFIRIAMKANDNRAFSDTSESSHVSICAYSAFLVSMTDVTSDGFPAIAKRTATAGNAFDARNSFKVATASLVGKFVKIRYECAESMFPNGLQWRTQDGKYLSDDPQAYMPNQDYVVKVGNNYATSASSFGGFYAPAGDVAGSGSVSMYFYADFELTKSYTDYEIHEIQRVIPQATVDMLSWGDSLTLGAGGNGTTYPQVCASELGLSVRNCGVGGESANTIAARQGGNTVVIPAGAINGTYSTLTDIYGANIAPLLQGSGSNSGNKLFINGEECSLSYSNGTYTISGYTGESSPVPLLGRFAGSDFHGKIVTIWVGTNGAAVGNNTGVEARISIIDSMIRHIGHDNYVVFSYWSSAPTAAEFAADDTAMMMHFGNKFFPVRQLLVNYGLLLMGISPTAQDEEDIVNGKIPVSLRSDSVHLNASGYTAVGKFLADKIRSLGYV